MCSFALRNPVDGYLVASQEISGCASRAASATTSELGRHCHHHAYTNEPLTLVPLVCAQLLGYMVLHAPSPSGRNNIAQEIVSCGNDVKFCHLAKYYVDHFLRCCEYLAGITIACCMNF
jgi:hypothetical protein